MEGILKIRESLKAFYAKFSIVIDPVVRFFGVFITLILMNDRLGYLTQLDNMALMILISAFCAIVPRGIRIIVLAACLLGNMYMVSYEALGMAALLLVLMYVLYYIFQPGDGDILYLVPVLFALKVPYIAPIVVGLSCGIMSAVPVAFGTILYYFLKWVVENASLLSSSSVLTIFQKLGQLSTGILQNQEMYVFVIAFVVATCVVYLIRRTSWKYSWILAVVAGSLVDILILSMGIYSFNLKLSLVSMLAGVLIGLLVGLVLAFFVFLVDYSRTVTTQFEDDEYYYYVKAVPKYSLSSEEFEVKQIAGSAGAKKRRSAGGDTGVVRRSGGRTEEESPRRSSARTDEDTRRRRPDADNARRRSPEEDTARRRRPDDEAGRRRRPDESEAKRQSRKARSEAETERSRAAGDEAERENVKGGLLRRRRQAMEEQAEASAEVPGATREMPVEQVRKASASENEQATAKTEARELTEEEKERRREIIRRRRAKERAAARKAREAAESSAAETGEQ